MSSPIATAEEQGGSIEAHKAATDTTAVDTDTDESSKPPPVPYSAFSPGKRRLILGIVTAAGFLGPLSGAIYLPALPLFENVFSASSTAINATVSVYMAVFAAAVSLLSTVSANRSRFKLFKN